MPGHTVHVAEPASFAFFCMMQTACPIDGNVALLSIQAGGTLHAAARADAAELEQPVEYRAVVAHVVFALLAHEAIHVVRRHLLKELDVFIRVKLRHLRGHRGLGALHGGVGD